MAQEKAVGKYSASAARQIPEIVLTEIAQTLNIDRDQIPLFDSFVELGGNISSAFQLEGRLKQLGIAVSADDVFRCRTIAELQTHARSVEQVLSPTAGYNGPPVMPMAMPMDTRSNGSPAHGQSASSSVYGAQSIYGGVPSVYAPKGFHGPSASVYSLPSVYGALPEQKALQGSGDSVTAREPAKVVEEVIEEPNPAAATKDGEATAVDRLMQDLEGFLSMAARGDHYCLLRVAAGPFKNNLVAFVSNKTEPVSEAKGFYLPVADQLKVIEERIRRISMALREWGAESPAPDLWIPVHAMVLKKNGNPALRALQWWLRNLADAEQDRIRNFQTILGQAAPSSAPGSQSSSRRASPPQSVAAAPGQKPDGQRSVPHAENSAEPSRNRQTYAPPTGPPPQQQQPRQQRLPPPKHPLPGSAASHTRNKSSYPPELVLRHSAIIEVPEPTPTPKKPKSILKPPKAYPLPDEPVPGLAPNFGLGLEPPLEPLELPASPPAEAHVQQYREPPQQHARHSVYQSKKKLDRKSSVLLQNRLSTTRPLKTFSMWIEDESGMVEGQELMAGESLDNVEFFPLSAMQQLFFRTSMNLNPDPNSITTSGYKYSQSILLEMKSSSKSITPQNAITALVDRHSMLRSRFRLTAEGWAQVILSESNVDMFRYKSRKIRNENDLDAIIERAVQSINPIIGPIFSADYITTSDHQQYLFLVAHHLAVDRASWRTLVSDLDELLREGIVMSNPSIPFSNWIEYQGYESSHRLTQPTLPFEVLPPSLGYWDLDLSDNTYGRSKQFSFSLDAETTRILQETCDSIFRTEPADVFLTALLLSFRRTFPDRDVPTMWTQEHGRDSRNPDFNIDQTVGWFTSLCPVHLNVDSGADVMELLKLMKDTRRLIPNLGIGFFNTEFLTPSQPFTTTPVEILFNCVDTWNRISYEGSLLRPASAPGRPLGSVNSDVGQDVGRLALYEFQVSIEDSGTIVDVRYVSPKRQDRIIQWLQTFESCVHEAIGMLSTMGPTLTRADAPLLNVTYEGLTKLASERLEQMGLNDVGEIETICPVSPNQQEILISQGQDPDSFYCHSLYELNTRDRKPVSQERLCAAWTTVVAAHSSMRSVFIDSISEDGLFDQVVLKRVSPEMLFLDSDRPVETLAALPSMKVTPGQPRHRLSVCKSNQRTYVRIDASQAVIDATSIDNIITRVRELLSGEEVSEDGLLLHTYLFNATTMDLSHSLHEWRSTLAHVRPCTFPVLMRKPPSKAERQSIFLPLKVERHDIHTFCIAREIQPAYVLQLAWALVLRAYVGMDHVSFGFEVAGRDENNLHGMKKAIGSFASLLPCTVELLPQRKIIECLKSFAEIAAIARRNDNPNMSEIHHATGLTSQDLFNTCLSLRDFDNARHHKPELDSTSFMASLMTSSRSSGCDVSMSTMFIGDNLHVDFTFRSMTVAQAETVVNTFEKAVKLILEDSNQTVDNIDLFTERDHSQLLVNEYEFKPREEKTNSCLHTLIYRHAQTRPNAPAIAAWDGHMTYHQMTYCVSTLATHLRNIGVVPGLAVPIVLEKSQWAPVIMLAVLKAGGSIIALDAQDKAAAEFTIKHLQPQIVLATDSALNDLVCIVPNLVIVNERFFSILPPQVSIPALSEPTPDHGAVIIFTPGKARVSAVRSLFFTHASLASTFMAQGPALRMSKDSRVLQLSSFSQDIALVEILGTMVHGGCVCIPSGKDRLEDLGGVMARMNITWSYMTATLARRLDPAYLPRLKTLCFRTRKLDDDMYNFWGSSRNIMLAYGATEICPLGISIAEVTGSTDSSVIPPPLIGKFWILNPEDSKKMMPIGAVGELAIDCPLLTPHTYIPDKTVVAPVSLTTEKPSRNRYLKTGHLVRYLDDGSIQFISSMYEEQTLDGSQLPVGEIEYHLRRYLGGKVDVVVESVVTRDAVQILAAFLEVGYDLEHNAKELEKLRTKTRERTQLLRALHDSSSKGSGKIRAITSDQIPSTFIPLKQFPMSTSMKVNRRKLAKKVLGMTYTELIGVSTNPDSEEEDKPLPLTHVEERMRHVWANVLDIQPSKIKSNDSFIGLGGDRFLAGKLVIQCRKSHLTIYLLDVLRGNTLTEICQAIATSEITFNERVHSEIRPTTMTEGGFNIPGFEEKFIKENIAPKMRVRRHDILDITEASAHQVRALETRMYSKKGGMQCLIFNFNGPIRVQKLQTACETLTQLHPAFRTAFAVHNRVVYQVHLGNFRPEFQRYPCPAWCLESVTANVVAEDQDSTFRPEEPVTKFTFLDAGAQSTLIVRLSSSQIDEQAMSILVQDLAALYEGSATLSDKSNFFDYMRAAQAVNSEASVAFWKDKLEGAQMTHFVAHEKPYPPAGDIMSVSQTIQVDPVSEFGLNFNTILKAAWAITLAQFSATSDVVFGEVTQGANIPLPDRFDMASLIAPTTNIIPVRIQFSVDQLTPLEFLRPIQEQRVTSRPHEGLGILELVQRCTDWPYWTNFSTVVHHRPQAPVDGSTTLNMGDTTFTHTISKAGMQDIPDILVVSTMDGPQTVTLEIKYSESRIPTDVAEDVLRVLLYAVESVTNYDTIETPMIQSSFDLLHSQAKIPMSTPWPLPRPDKSYQSLPNDDRKILQSLIFSVWTEVLNPQALGVPSDHVHRANFFDLWGSVLPAQAMAERLNDEFSKQPIKGLHRVYLYACDITENPTMSMQYDFIVKKLADEGIVSGIVKKKGHLSWGSISASALSIRHKSTGSMSSGPSSHASISAAPPPTPGPIPGPGSVPPSPAPYGPGKPTIRDAENTKSIRKTLGGKLRGLRQHKHKTSGGSIESHKSSLVISEPVAIELPPRAAEIARGGSGAISTPSFVPPPHDLQPPPAGHHVPFSPAVPSPAFAREFPQEMAVSPMSAMPPKRRSMDSDNTDPTSPVSPLGPAWLAN
ncbi:unnamed protein product [Clonostachys chloroleuca]|uniref:Carrier domain-containing protein n=1 Tax=Clonostachys chloroleuca TaxID=1926264 RepID=A0AA35Q3C5_9HYPO|nr:unnamed protein product [Clonostachys chloroleuca]